MFLRIRNRKRFLVIKCVFYIFCSEEYNLKNSSQIDPSYLTLFINFIKHKLKIYLWVYYNK